MIKLFLPSIINPILCKNF